MYVHYKLTRLSSLSFSAAGPYIISSGRTRGAMNNNNNNQPFPVSVRSEYERTNDGKIKTLRDGTPCIHTTFTVHLPNDLPLTNNSCDEFEINSARNRAIESSNSKKTITNK